MILMKSAPPRASGGAGGMCESWPCWDARVNLFHLVGFCLFAFGVIFLFGGFVILGVLCVVICFLLESYILHV
jgi:hypothetical protein